MAFNPNDARLQRDLQRSAAKNSMGGSRGIASVMSGRVAGAHAGRQQQTQQNFRQLALQGEMSRLQHAHRMAQSRLRGREIGLGEQNLNFRRGSLKDQMKDIKESQLFGLISGLGGTAYSYMEGRDRKAKLAAANALEAQRYRDTQLQMKENQGILRAMIAGRPLGTSTHLRGGL